MYQFFYSMHFIGPARTYRRTVVYFPGICAFQPVPPLYVQNDHKLAGCFYFK